VTVDQEQALMVHPLFGLFAEPASTMLVSTNASRVDDIEELADHFGFNAARIGTTGGDRLEISVYKDVFVSAELTELRRPWSAALEATLHDEVTA
jgi:phosphoribosylformylglycinamidine synthase